MIEAVYIAMCDSCGTDDINFLPIYTDYVKRLEEEGWYVGIITLCPVCSKEIDTTEGL